METAPLRPELREVLFPGSDYFGWTHLYILQANAEDFLPHLTEPLQRTEAPSSLHIQVERSTWKLRYFEDRGLLRPIRINRRPSPSTSVGAGVDEDEGLGRLRRPRPVPLTDILPKHDHLPTPRATIKALPSPHRPPSPLRIARPPA